LRAALGHGDDDALRRAIRAALLAKPQRHEFVEKPRKVVRVMAQTGGQGATELPAQARVAAVTRRSRYASALPGVASGLPRAGAARMIKVVIPFRRRPGMGMAAFQEHWRTARVVLGPVHG
jgi:hypothetical protein